LDNQIQVNSTDVDGSNRVLTKEAIDFVIHLNKLFAPRRNELLAMREAKRNRIAKGENLDFLAETASIRSSEWKVALAPKDLQDRRVEITGPTDPKMAINALNSGAKVWLADLEDSNTPHWKNVIEGQVTLQGAARRTLKFTSPEGKVYQLNNGPLATLVVRPRGWHLDERHIRIDNQPIVGAIFDAGMHLFHNAKTLLEIGSGPYFYLAKMESYLEARLWIGYGSVRATVLIETIPAAFQMEEILYELREHASGLNAGRWDYLFSMIKVFRDAGTDYVIPDRGAVTMTAPMMRAYTDLLVATCHKRGALAIGGMAAFVPSRRDEEVNKIAFAKVRADKIREAGDGFDGSWVAHPDLVPVCNAVFDSVLGNRPNQLEKLRSEVMVSASDLLAVSQTPGEITEAGMRLNIEVSLQYLAAWIGGNGAVAIHNLMEDAATVEISRSQIWQQIENSVKMSDTGNIATKELVRHILGQEQAKLLLKGFDAKRLEQASQLFERVSLDDNYADFLTLPAMDLID
jgi:malate synthase